MIGRDSAHAVPTLIIGCRRRTVRKRAESLIKKSGLLDRFPGVVLKTSASTPQPLAEEESSLPFDLLTDTIYAAGNPQHSCGVQIILGQAGRLPCRSAQRATLGGVVQVGSKDYGLTVAHALGTASTHERTDEEQTDYIQFDSDTDSDNGSVVEGTSKGQSP
jgi:hypothetical protein